MGLYKNFSKRELACRCGKCGLGEKNMNPAFMEKIVELRLTTGIKMPATSAVRCVTHNLSVSKTGSNGPHLTWVLIENSMIDGIPQAECHAMDINVWGRDATVILEAIGDLKLGMTGVGLNQKGPYNQRFIHLDDCPNAYKQPRPWIWTY